jgi:hypothetical protein
MDVLVAHFTMMCMMLLLDECCAEMLWKNVVRQRKLGSAEPISFAAYEGESLARATSEEETWAFRTYCLLMLNCHAKLLEREYYCISVIIPPM